MRTFAGCVDRESSATLRALDQMAVQRDATHHVNQIVRGLNDPAAVVGSISQSRDFATLPVSHPNSLFMRCLQRQPVKRRFNG